MKISKRKLQRIIKEERYRLNEEKKFQAMLLKEEDGGLLGMAFQALKDQGPKVADKMKQWMKANPEIFQELIDEMMEDGAMKDFIQGALPAGEGGGEEAEESGGAEPEAEEAAEEEKKIEEARRRIKRRLAKARRRR